MDKIMVFIPMYNCKNQIVRVLDQFDEEMSKYISEVVIVNNRSTDDGENAVVDYLKSHDLKTKFTLLRNNQNYGLGGSHKVAFNYAIKNNYDYIIVLHGDDQGAIKDFKELLDSKEYQKYTGVLGARFMKKSKLIGYSKTRIIGNKGFNLLFSIISGKKVYDLGSGLNMYKVNDLKDKHYLTMPDTLYFNDCMILYHCYKKERILFYPITWRETDQVSNNKILKFSMSLLKMLFRYRLSPRKYFSKDMSNHNFTNYDSEVVIEIGGK